MAKKSNGKTIIIVKHDKPKPKKQIKKDYKVGHKKPPKEHQFKKGVSANPGGYSKEKRALANFTKEELSKAISIVMSSTEKEAEDLLKCPNQTLSFKVVLRAVVDAAHNGDYDKFYKIAEHIMGKLTTKIDITTLGAQLGAAVEDKTKVRAALESIEKDI